MSATTTSGRPRVVEEAIREGIESQDDEGTEIEFMRLGPPRARFVSPTSGAVETAGAGDRGRRRVRARNSRPPAAPPMRASWRSIARWWNCGLPGPTMHKADECVPLPDVQRADSLYGAFIQRYPRRKLMDFGRAFAWRSPTGVTASSKRAKLTRPSRSAGAMPSIGIAILVVGAAGTDPWSAGGDIDAEVVRDLSIVAFGALVVPFVLFWLAAQLTGNTAAAPRRSST